MREKEGLKGETGFLITPYEALLILLEERVGVQALRLLLRSVLISAFELSNPIGPKVPST